LIGEEAHITTLAVHPDHRRIYIGERLLVHDIGEAQKVGASWMTLEVRVSNDSAQRLYYKYGFKNLGVRRNYYQDNNEDALVLWTENMSSTEFKKLVAERVLELKSRESSLAQQAVPPVAESSQKNPPPHGGIR
jgi:ribosomal-protein-alanine N-acetyltransferase